MSRGARIRRWVLVIASIIVLPVVVVLVLLHLPPVLDFVRAQIEQRVSATMNGRLVIGALEGSILSRLSARAIRLQDEDGTDVLAVEQVDVDTAWLDSISEGALVLDAVEVRRPRVHLVTYEDGNSFSELFESSTSTPTATSTSPAFSPVPILVRSAELTNGALVLRTAGSTDEMRFEDIALFGQARIGKDRITASIEHLGVEASMYPSPLALSGDVTLRSDGLTAGAVLRDGVGSRIELEDYTLTYEGLAMTGRFDARVRGRAFLPPPTQGAVSIHGRFSHEAEGRWRVAAAGEVGNAPLELDAGASDAFDDVTAQLSIGPGTDLATYHPDLPHTDLGLRATLDLDDGDRLAADITIEGNGLDADAEVVARLGATPPVLEHARADVAVANVKRLLGDVAPVGGRISLQVVAEGPIDDPTGRIELEGEEVVVADMPLGEIAIDARRERASAPWHVELAVEGNETFQDLTAEARVAIDGEDIGVTIDELRSDAFGSRWSVRPGGRVEVGGGGKRLQVEELAVDAGDTRMTVSADVDLDRGTVNALDVRIPELDVETIRRAADIAPAGEVAQRVDAALSARLVVAGGRARADVSLFGERLGRARFVAGANLPRRPLEPTSWQRVDERILRRGRLTISRLHVGRAQAIFGVEPTLTGVLSGNLLIEKGQIARGSFDLEDGSMPGLAPELTIFASLKRPENEWLRARVAALLDGTPVLETELGLALEVAKVRRQGVDALLSSDLEATARLSRFPLEAVTLQGRNLSGTVTGTIALAQRGEKLDLDVDALARGLRWDLRWPVLDLDLDATASGRDLEVSGTVEGGRAGRLAVEAKGRAPAASAANLAAWTSLELDDFSTIEIVLGEADLELWSDVLNLPGLTGALEARAVVREGGRRAEAIVAADRLVMSEMPEPLDGSIYLKSGGESTRVEATMFLDRRPLLDAWVKAPLTPRALTQTSTEALARLPLRGIMEASEVPMTLLASVIGASADVSGSMSIEGVLDGTLEDPRFDLSVRSDDARIAGAEMEKLSADLALRENVLLAQAEMRQTHGGSLDLEGDVGLLGEKAFDVEIAANHLDLSFLSILSGTAGSTFGGVTGRMDGDMRLFGTAGEPKARGELHIDELDAVLVHPIPPMSDVRADIVVAGERIGIDIDGESGDGTFSIFGDVDLSQPTVELVADVDVDDVPIAAGPKILETDLTANIRGTMKDRLDVEVIITDGGFELPSEGADQRLPIDELEHVVMVDELDPLRRPPVIETPAEEEGSGPAFAYRIRIRTDGELPIRSPDLNARVFADLTLETRSGVLVNDGIVEVTSGTVQLFGRRWVIDTAEVRLTPNPDAAPRIAVEILHEFPEVVIYVRLSGSIEDPRIAFSSDPGIYSQDQILGFVLGGTPNAAESDTPLADQAVGAAAGFLLGQVQSKLRDKLPIDTVSVDLGEGTTARGITVGKWISSRIFVAYDHNLAPEPDENVNAGLIQLRIGSGWILETTYGDRGIGGADVLYRKRF